VELLPCCTIVFRTITKRQHVGPDGRPLNAAFLRRGPDKDGRLRDRSGLSVNYNVDVPDGCAPGFSNKRLIVSLHVGWVRDSGLKVIADSPTHANIAGMPYHHDDEEAAEQYAAEIRRLCRNVWPLTEES
jgi:hypothetical protein